MEAKPVAWAVFSDSGNIEQFANEGEARAAYKQAIDDNPIVADFIHLSPLFSIGDRA